MERPPADMEERRFDIERLLAHTGWVKSLARSLVRDPAGADDLAQDTLVAALDRAPSPEPGLKRWLGAVARKLALRRQRDRARREQRHRDGARAGAEPSAAERAAEAELRKLIGEAVVDLEEPYRTTVMLRYFGDLSSAEIARRQGVPEGTVRSRLKRALDRLRRDLDERHGGREAWAGAVLGLLSPEGALAGGAVGAAIAEGFLAMKTILVGVAAAAVIAVGVVGVWQLTSRPEAALPSRGVVARPDGPVEPIAERASEVDAAGESAHGAERREATVIVPEPESAGPKPAAKLVAFLEARLVDELGRGLAGGTMAIGETIARAASDGRARLERELTHDGEAVDVRLSYAGLATRFARTRLRGGETVHLGAVVLGPAGTISGHVEDELGRPLVDARVFVSGVEGQRRDPGALRRHGPVLDMPVVETTTGPNGRFLLDGVATGFVRVWANAERCGYASQGPFEILPDASVNDVILVLEELREDDRIRGVVLSPQGDPVPMAQVGYSYRFGNTNVASSVTADEEGVFSLTVDHHVAYHFQVSDPDDRWPTVVLLDVEPGTTDVVVQFVDTREIQVAVKDRSGVPVEDFELRFEDASTGGVSGVSHGALVRVARATHPGGVVRARVPTIVFEIAVDAPGYELAMRGPFEPDAVPDVVDLELTTLPGIHGRVLANGEPVAGARVGLRKTVGDGTLSLKNGFRCVVNPYDALATETDEDGRFHLYPRQSGEYLIRVERRGYATGELGPLAIETSRSLEGLEVMLGGGGAIEGWVLVAAGEDPAGVIVGLNHGDGEARTFRTGPDGSYRFEELAPGLWELTQREAELTPGTSRSSIGPNSDGQPPTWSCEVFEGQTTFFDLDLRAKELARLH
ncbi:MAG: sigma-70 family RNA polymerase sigma factor, partial [Planctomycetota bacterium]|nr:sigma-70 family RNA polymerase sigma factor [Planctomycetota bacterium]